MERLGNSGAKEVASLQEKVSKQAQHNAEIGKTKAQIEALRSVAEEAATKELEDQANAIALLLEKESGLLDYGNTQYVVSEQARPIYELELKTLREQIALRKQLAAGFKEGAAAEIAKKNKDAAAKAAKEVEREFKKASDAINNALTNALMTAFEKGGSFAEVFAEGIKQEFKQMVLRPTVAAIMNPISQGISSFGTNVVNSAAGSFGSSALGSMLGTSGAATLSMSSLGTAFGTGFSASMGGASISGSAAAASFATEGAVGASTAGSLGASLAVAMPYIAAAVAIYALAGGFKGDYVKGAGYSDQNFAAGSSTGVQNQWIDRHGGYNPVDMYTSPEAKTFVDGLQQAYLASAKSLGINAVATTFGSSANSTGTSVVVGGAGSNLFQSSEIKNTDQAAMALAASRAVFTALQSSEMPAYLARVFNGITASTASQQAIDSAFGFANALKSTRDALTETRTPLDILRATVASSFTKLGTNAKDWKADFVAAIDAGLTPETFAEWTALGNNVTALDAAAGKASHSVSDIANNLLGLTKTGDQLAIDLQKFTDPTAAATAQRTLDTKGMTQEEIEQYDTNAGFRKQIANATERKGLQDQLDELTMTNTDLLTKQRNALDESNRGLFDQVQAAKNATDTRVRNDAAAARVSESRASMLQQIAVLEGESTQQEVDRANVLIYLNKQDPTGMLETLARKLWGLEDAASAAATAAGNLSLAQRLSISLGKDTTFSIARQNAGTALAAFQGNKEVGGYTEAQVQSLLSGATVAGKSLKDFSSGAQTALKDFATASIEWHNALTASTQATEQNTTAGDDWYKKQIEAAEKFAAALQSVTDDVNKFGKSSFQVQAYDRAAQYGKAIADYGVSRTVDGRGHNAITDQLETLWKMQDAKAIQDLQDESVRKLIDSQKVLHDAQVNYASTLKDTIKSMKDFIGSLDNGASPLQNLTNARDKFGAVAARAAAGDTTAYAEIPAAGKEFLSLSKSYSKSIQDYQRDEASVRATVNSVMEVTQRELGKLPADIAKTADPIKDAWAKLAEATLAEAVAHNTVAGLSADIAASTSRINASQNDLFTRYAEILASLPASDSVNALKTALTDATTKADALTTVLTDQPDFTFEGNFQRYLVTLMPAGFFGTKFDMSTAGLTMLNTRINAVLPDTIVDPGFSFTDTITTLVDDWLGASPIAFDSDPVSIREEVIAVLDEYFAAAPRIVSGADISVPDAFSTALTSYLSGAPSITGESFSGEDVYRAAVASMVPSMGAAFNAADMFQQAIASAMPSITGGAVTGGGTVTTPVAPVTTVGGTTNITNVTNVSSGTSGLDALKSYYSNNYAPAEDKFSDFNMRGLQKTATYAKSIGLHYTDLGNVVGTDANWLLAKLGIPAFDVGTNYVPQDMIAQIHKGEAIIPAAYNPAGGNDPQRLERLVEALTAEVQRLREEQRAGHSAIASNTSKGAKVLDKWDQDGMPATTT